MPDFEYAVDVIVMGGGACGAVAALAARERGAEVLLLEADAYPMGTTGMSMGVLCAAGTASQAAHGINDDGARFMADIMAKTRGLADPAIAHAIAFHSGPALDWLVERHGFPWELDTSFRAAYGNSCLRVHGWRGHNGQDMLDLLHARLSEASVAVMLQAKVTEIFAADGKVGGLALQRPDGTTEQVGCGALVIASGGFAANHAMLAEHIPDMAHARNNGHEGSRGEGIRLAQKLGAATGDMAAYQGYGMLTDPHGISVAPGVLIDGGILVNREGKRFVDESEDIAGVVHPVMAQTGGQVWVIYDSRIESQQAHVPEMATLAELNAPRAAATVAELAETIGVDPVALAHTLETVGNGADAFGRDWSAEAPPKPPYRALKAVGAIYHTQGGLQIDGAARVQRADGTAFANLFAGGGAARSVSGPAHWGYLPAMGLCTAVTLGRLAGIGAAHATGKGE